MNEWKGTEDYSPSHFDTFNSLGAASDFRPWQCMRYTLYMYMMYVSEYGMAFMLVLVIWIEAELSSTHTVVGNARISFGSQQIKHTSMYIK